MNFCTKCGTKNEENLNFCSNCGNSLNPTVGAPSYEGTPMVANQKNGKATASLVLGIIAAVWGLLALCSLGGIEEALIEALAEYPEVSEVTGKIAFGFGYNLLSLICGIIGLILGLVAKKNGKAIAGIITSSVGLITVVVSYAVIFSVAV